MRSVLSLSGSRSASRHSSSSSLSAYDTAEEDNSDDETRLVHKVSEYSLSHSQASRGQMRSSVGAPRRSARQRPAKTHPTITAKHNQMYLITSSGQHQALINRVLPKELILSLCRCAQTCRVWNELALDGSNWQEVDLFSFQKDVKAPVIENLARRCGGFLKKLSLKGCENVHDSALRTFTAKCANIEELSLYKCKRVSDATCENLGRYSHKLVRLNLENCTAITDRALRSVSDGCKNLEYLNISWCDNITDRGLQYVLTGCPQLNTLILRGCEGLTEHMFDNAKGHISSLVHLNVFGCFVTDETVEAIAGAAPLLEAFNLSMCTQITDRSLVALANGCKKLTDVELSGCSLLSDTGFVQLARGCRHLERLDLEDVSLITDASIEALSQACPNLTNLSLSHCELITDDALQTLCANHKDKLRVLELDNCPLISDTSLSHLRHLRCLERVDLYDCANISKEAIQRFKHHRPGVEIHAYFAPATPPVQAPPRPAICKCCVIL